MPDFSPLSALQLAANFADLPPALNLDEALAEAGRCLYCFDAPCTRACPTAIDVPKFIRQISHRDTVGAARTILEANVFGGSCARACPTEVLCEGACVETQLVKSPIAIGRLQRFAVDAADARGIRFFEPGPPTGKRVAVIGSGPAGLSCAHELRRLGHDVVVFEARNVPGGLDTLGIAAYKVSTEYALAEIDRVRQIGIEIRLNHRVTFDDVRTLVNDYDAIFLGIGLGRTKPLEIDGEDLPIVWEALDFIFQTHERPLQECRVGKHVLVIGAGNTAIDVATAAKRLGAETVTIAYRRGEDAMPAFTYEYGLAKADGVRFEWFAQPVRVFDLGVEFVRTVASCRKGGVTTVPCSNFVIEADMVVKALGQQHLIGDPVPFFPKDDRGRIVVDPETGATSVFGVFAGGDCLRNGGEVVDAVRDGKKAAHGIHKSLT